MWDKNIFSFPRTLSGSAISINVFYQLKEGNLKIKK